MMLELKTRGPIALSSSAKNSKATETQIRHSLSHWLLYGKYCAPFSARIFQMEAKEREDGRMMAGEKARKEGLSSSFLYSFAEDRLLSIITLWPSAQMCIFTSGFQKMKCTKFCFLQRTTYQKCKIYLFIYFKHSWQEMLHFLTTPTDNQDSQPRASLPSKESLSIFLLQRTQLSTIVHC